MPLPTLFLSEGIIKEEILFVSVICLDRLERTREERSTFLLPDLAITLTGCDLSSQGSCVGRVVPSVSVLGGGGLLKT